MTGAGSVATVAFGGSERHRTVAVFVELVVLATVTLKREIVGGGGVEVSTASGPIGGATSILMLFEVLPPAPIQLRESVEATAIGSRR
jgi:hypothetical protein